MSYIFEVVGFKMSGFLKFFGESLIVLDEDGYILSSNGVDKSDLTGFNYIDACAELSRRGSPIAEMLLKHLTDVIHSDDGGHVSHVSIDSESRKRFYELSLFRINIHRKRCVIIYHHEVTHYYQGNQSSSFPDQLDDLTGIYNRSYMDECLVRENKIASRSGSPVSLVMIDIDFFKAYNDIEGRTKGDLCLQKVAMILSGFSRREGDLCFRYSDACMTILMGSTPFDYARKVAENVVRSVEQLKIPNPGSQCSKHITVSAGITTIIPEATTQSRELIDIAEELLYLAKSAGHNQSQAMDLSFDVARSMADDV